MTRVTVVLPVHNGERHIAAAITSVLAQTYTDFTVIILDDGSTDSTPRIISQFSDPRIRVVRQERLGLTATLRRALAMADTELIARQDADDVSMPDRLRRQIVWLDEHPDVALVGCSVDVINDDGGIIGEYSYPVAHEELVQLLHELVTPLPHSTLLFRKAEIDGVGGYRMPFAKAQDFDLLLRVAERHRIASLSESLCHVRYAATSLGADHGSGSQFRYAVLALACAYAREDTGRDPLDGPAAAAFQKSFDSWFDSSAYPRLGEARRLRRNARVALSRGQYIRGLQQLARAVRHDPGWLLRVSRVRRPPEGSDARAWALNG